MTVDESRERVEKENYSDNFPVGMRVLAVDDDPISLKLLECLLRKCQYHVTVTNQARVALEMLRENKDRFDLVISDVHMPDMDGFKLLELVGLEMDLPVIMLSANSDTSLVMKGVTHGACDYLVKPVRIEELRNVWQHVIRKKKVDPKLHSKSGEEGRPGDQLSGTVEQNEKLNKRRKDEEDGSVDRCENEEPGTQKKPRVVWSVELHRKFVDVVNQLGIEKAVPKKILDLMNVEGLTRENVASHLQKYRLYLRRISLVSTPQDNMATPYMRMGSLDGFGDLRTLAGPGQLNRATLPSYAPGSMLGRLNSSAGVSLQNVNPLGLLQPSQAQGSRNSLDPLGKLNSNAPPPTSQNPSLFLGIPSLELDQLRHGQFTKIEPDLNPLDNSKLLAAATTFTGSGSGFGNPINAAILQGNSGFGNPHSLNMTSLRSEPLNTGVISSSSNFLGHGGLNGNLQNSILASNVYPLMDQNHVRGNYSFAGPHLQSSPLGYPLMENSRGQTQYQEGFIGDAIQTVNQAPTQFWGDHEQNHNSNNVFSNPSSQILGTGLMPSLTEIADQNNDIFNMKTDTSLIGQENGGSVVLFQNNENGNFNQASNGDYMLNSTKTQGAYASLDDLMNGVINEEQNGQFGFNDYSFGP